MFPSALFPVLPPHVAMLLVLLPPVGPAAGQQLLAVRTTTLLLLNTLQQQVGTAIRVLRIDEASHPAVVHSFDGRGLPAFVLIRDGVELWRQQGLPEGERMAAQLLSKLETA